jgi:hypothetical protein
MMREKTNAFRILLEFEEPKALDDGHGCAQIPAGPQGRASTRKNSAFAEMSATDYFWATAGGGNPRIITDISAAQRNTRYHQIRPR